MIHIRLVVLGVELASVHIELPTPAEQIDAVDDAIHAEINEHVRNGLLKWWRGD